MGLLYKRSIRCKMSHYYIVKAKELDLDYVIILEDDFLFTDNADDILKNSIFENIDDNWDFIFLGGRLSGNNIKINNIVTKTESVITTIGYILNKKLMIVY